MEGAYQVKVTVNRRLTPESYERNVFHIEFDTTGIKITFYAFLLNIYSGTNLKYEIGEALGVHGHNDCLEVKSFLEFYKLNPTDLVSLPLKKSKQVQIKTVEQLFIQYLVAIINFI